MFLLYITIIMRKILNRSNIFITFLILINILPNSPIRMILVAFVVAESIINLYVINKKKVAFFIKGLNAIIALFTIYGAFLIVSNPFIYGVFGDRVSNSSYLTTIYISLLPIYSFYRYTEAGYFDDKSLRIWVIILLGAATYRYFQLETHLIQIISDRGLNVEDVTNNTAYIFLSVLPLLFLFKEKQALEYGFLLYCIAFMMMSMKRGAMLIAVVCIIILLIGNKKKQNKSIISEKQIGYSVVILFFIYYIYINYLSTNDYFISKIESEGGSGRTDMYFKLFNSFVDNYEFFSMIFGKGANASIIITGNYAHNDWLEILINQGIIGILIYLYYWKCFLTEVRQNKGNVELFYPLLLLFVMTLSKSFFSMSYAGMSYVDCLALGFYTAKSATNR